MVRLKRLNGAAIVVNADVIESLESTPDTVLRLTSGQRLAVQETVDEVVEKVTEYRRAIRRRPGRGIDSNASKPAPNG